jgi:hypothetical protein
MGSDNASRTERGSGDIDSVEVEAIQGLCHAGFAASAHGMRIGDRGDGDRASVCRATGGRGATGNGLCRRHGGSSTRR